MSVNNDLSEWIRLANMDITTAHHMFDTYHPKPLEIVCFHSQQAAEKIIKCYLVSKDVEPPKIHDMQVLIEMCIEFDDEFNDIYVEATTLTNYAVRLRYPTELGLEETDTIQAINNADKVMAFVKNKLDIDINNRITFEEFQQDMEGEAEKAGIKNEKDVIALCREVRAESAEGIHPPLPPFLHASAY